MRPRSHVIYGGAGAAALYPVLGSGSLWFWGASVLIDIDHYIDFVYHNRFKSMSFSGMFRYHAVLNGWRARPAFLNIEIFHTMEFIIPVAAASWWTASPALLAITLGLVFHVTLDIVSLSVSGAPFARAHSFAEYFIRKRTLARRGLDPALIYEEAIENINRSV